MNFLSTILGMEDYLFWILLSALIAVIGVIVIIVLVQKLHRRPGKTAQKVKVKKGVRYSVDKVIEVGKSVNVTHNQGDIALAKGKTYTARKKGGDLLPGQYTLLTSAKGEDKFNIRLGGLMREYSHGDAIVIPEGESITPTSHAVILR